MRAIHKFIYSGEEPEAKNENEEGESDENRNTSEWFISRRQKEFRDDKNK
jgi:hypothetical protein